MTQHGEMGERRGPQRHEKRFQIRDSKIETPESQYPLHCLTLIQYESATARNVLSSMSF